MNVLQKPLISNQQIYKYSIASNKLCISARTKQLDTKYQNNKLATNNYFAADFKTLFAN